MFIKLVKSAWMNASGGCRFYKRQKVHESKEACKKFNSWLGLAWFHISFQFQQRWFMWEGYVMWWQREKILNSNSFPFFILDLLWLTFTITLSSPANQMIIIIQQMSMIKFPFHQSKLLYLLCTFSLICNCKWQITSFDLLLGSFFI